MKCCDGGGSDNSAISLNVIQFRLASRCRPLYCFAAAASAAAPVLLAPAANMLLRIDDIVSGISKRQAGGGGGPSGPQVDDHENVDTEQMLPE